MAGERGVPVPAGHRLLPTDHHVDGVEFHGAYSEPRVRTSERRPFLALPDGTAELFDARTDLAQATSLAVAEGAEARESVRARGEHATACAEFSRRVEKVPGPLSLEERERLRALGYIR